MSSVQHETLEILEWGRLCQHLSTFAATKLGMTAAQQMRIPDLQAESEQLLAQTAEIYRLDLSPSGGLKFEGIRDIGMALERAAYQGMLTGSELLEIASTLAGMRQMRRTIAAQEDIPVLAALVDDVRTYPDLEQAIHFNIDDRGQVADRASEKLAGIRQQQRQLRDQVYQKLQGILQRQSGAVQEALITQRSDRFVIPVKAAQKDAIPGIVHDTSASGVTLYVEPNATVPLNNQLRQLQRQEEVEIERILRQLTDRIAEVQGDLEHLLAIATILDLAAARARYSLWLQANPPQFTAIGRADLPKSSTPAATITLRQLRHPLLIWQQHHEQGQPVVPIDIIIRPPVRVVAITGPNTGGKTATLKALGLAMLMARVGLFIPAREPVELPWFSQILADIGDEQSLQQNLSTFSGHIRRISRILDALGSTAPAMTQNEPPIADEAAGEAPDAALEIDRPTAPTSAIPVSALVLLDEVGAGTDPSEGSALAIALLQHLAERALLTIATTHFGELKSLKYQDDRFENASVEFNEATLSPTYRLLWGVPGRSNALAIARRLGLAGEIVDQAQTYITGFSQDINQMITGLEEQRRSQEERAQAAAELLAQAEKLHRELNDRARILQEREQALRRDQEQIIQAEIAAAKAEIAAVIRRLQQGNSTAQEAQKATEQLNQIAEKQQLTKKAPPKPDYRPKVGDRIRIPSLGQTAEVLSVDEATEQVTARFGLMKMTIAFTDIESLAGEKISPKAKLASDRSESRAKPEPEPSPEEPSNLTMRTSKNTLDLRGSRVADAEIEIDRALAEADQVLWIIHGHGTGRLRKGIKAFLDKHPLVKRHTYAEQADGGSGVTIVYLK